MTRALQFGENSVKGKTVLSSTWSRLIKLKLQTNPCVEFVTRCYLLNAICGITSTRFTWTWSPSSVTIARRGLDIRAAWGSTWAPLIKETRPTSVSIVKRPLLGKQTWRSTWIRHTRPKQPRSLIRVLTVERSPSLHSSVPDAPGRLFLTTVTWRITSTPFTDAFYPRRPISRATLVPETSRAVDRWDFIKSWSIWKPSSDVLSVTKTLSAKSAWRFTTPLLMQITLDLNVKFASNDFTQKRRRSSISRLPMTKVIVRCTNDGCCIYFQTLQGWIRQKMSYSLSNFDERRQI